MSLRFFLIFFVSFNLCACATYQSKIGGARSALSVGDYNKAVELIAPLAAKEDGDQLVYLLDYATALQFAGRYAESNAAFLQADKLQEQLDYQSVSRVAGSLLASEELKQYKGDTFEKVFINAQLALNFLALGQTDSALVECRRINNKFKKLKADDNKDVKLNPFAKYLAALIWESIKSYDDAAIAYKEAYSIDPTIDGIEEDLLRSSMLAQRDADHQKWRKSFPQAVDKFIQRNPKDPELIIISQIGWGPQKEFSPVDYRWPVLKESHTPTKKIKITADGKNYESKLVYDVTRAAIATLEDDRLSLLGRRMAGLVAKDLVAEKIRKENELAGILAFVAMRVSDRADLRQWSTLPSQVQVTRLPLKAGKNEIVIQGYGAGGEPTNYHSIQTVHITKASQKVFLNLRIVQ
jgi:uncharacterized protein